MAFVPLATPTQCSTPTYAENSSSNATRSGPCRYHPLAATRSRASRVSAPRASASRDRSLTGMVSIGIGLAPEHVDDACLVLGGEHRRGWQRQPLCVHELTDRQRL